MKTTITIALLILATGCASKQPVSLAPIGSAKSFRIMVAPPAPGMSGYYVVRQQCDAVRDIRVVVERSADLCRWQPWATNMVLHELPTRMVWCYNHFTLPEPTQYFRAVCMWSAP